MKTRLRSSLRECCASKGYAVRKHVGTYSDGAQADGVVAVMQNGPGSHLLIRTEMDALPVEEQTELGFCADASVKWLDGPDVMQIHHDLAAGAKRM